MPINRPKAFNRVIKIKTPEIVNILDNATDEYNNNESYKYDVLSMMLNLLFIIVYRFYTEMFDDIEFSYFETVNKIQLQFESDICKAYSLSKPASEYHIGKYYLSHVF